METRKENQLRYLFAALLVVTAMGLTQCQSPSDRIAVTPAAKDEHVKATVADTSTVNWKTAIAQVARDNIPAVVNIDVTQRREISNPMMPFGNAPFSHSFFNGPQAPQKFKQELRGLGTGMLIDDKGNILTNNHAVAGATEINVLLADGTSYPGKLVGTDPKTDLAVIRIAADEKLPAVTFGDSDQMEVGDWVVAIGHPRGIGALGYTLQTPLEDRFLMSRSELLGKIKGLLGGRAAEELVFGEVSAGAANDLEKMADIVRNMLTVYGMIDQLPNRLLVEKAASNPFLGQGPAMQRRSETLETLIDKETLEIINTAYQSARQILGEHRIELEAMAKLLLEQEKIGYWSVVAIGISGMVGGGIFAVLGLSVQMTSGAAPVAFMAAGLVAMVTGTTNILLWISYIVMLSLYAFAFGSYGAAMFPEESRLVWKHVMISAGVTCSTGPSPNSWINRSMMAR